MNHCMRMFASAFDGHIQMEDVAVGEWADNKVGRRKIIYTLYSKMYTQIAAV